MKTKINIFKTAILAVALTGTTQIFAQIFPNAPTGIISTSADLNVGTVTNNTTFASVTTNTVGFYKPNTAGTASVTGVTLEASLDDNGTAPGGVAFANYLWYELSYDGITETETLITGQTAQTLTRSDLPAGYHKYRVRGQVGDPSLYCPSDDYQDMIVFVLPQLDVAPVIAGATVFCENNAQPTTLSATITADYSANLQSYPKPAATDFSLTYNWYAIPASAPATTISLGTTPTVDLSTLTTPLAPDTYTFYLDVEYDSNIRAKGGRTYVTYGGTATATTQTVVVTATPGTPTITVTGVTD